MLDTHVLIWWLRDDPKLGQKARAHIAQSGGGVLVSIASLWEVSVKFRIGKLIEQGSLLWQEMETEGFQLVPITPEHLQAVESLPRLHKDPFDYLILAQAKVEGARILTSDRDMAAYGIPCIPATR